MKRTCPDCGGRLHQICIIDRGTKEGYQLISDVIRNLAYVHPRSHVGEKLFQTGEYTVAGNKTLLNDSIEGVVDAFACNGCGRVLLYATPYEEQ